MTTGATAETAVVLTLEGVTKSFEGQRAVDRVDLTLHAGEIHALLGQNGSGKSTLIKLLAGYHQPSAVTRAELNGQPFELGSGAAARDGGLRFIHQDLGLIGDLDVIDNLALGAAYANSWWLSNRKERDAARVVCARYGFAVDVTSAVGALGPAEKTMVAIVRALSSRAAARSVLVLDEPTAALPDHDVSRLFALLSELRSQGASILYVTHRLSEVFEIADRVSVLRDGRHVATRFTRDLDYDSLLELIIGRPMDAQYPTIPAASSTVALDVRNLRGGRVRDVSFTAQRGEVVGITGLVGSGYESVLSMIFDSGARLAGTVAVNGTPLPARGVRAAIRAGLGYVPADRKRLAAMLMWTVRENLTLPALRPRGVARWLGGRSECDDSRDWLTRLQVTPDDPERMFSGLSGGNQQKVILARWLRAGAQVYLLDEPTNGVDLLGKHALYEALATAAASGAAVVLASSDLEELCALCDRVLVVRDGVVGRTLLAGGQLTVEMLGAECTRDLAAVTHGDQSDAVAARA